ncbi:MAG: hypothetical protein COU63_00220 [Candidatus Pacebacteria bacterium CG10_big_fil_rev_8_21_14_0_10_36_11]|nr:hypothetical protein [Candidatus Pacearchaeota archaeon]OIP74182.1 MAG: hypothetical protein AUK08_02970 [Candidatus Pacebacteria bacterium CG2_30_36_39]PIQ80521.1 MAG: hypothetical protein COV78_04980 [Candidatus Pacebacteria bacterium CG11_big_fil_rev_8_21_14_0_20_34_55]PIR65084.1 MAG: hypothetical protein COU63_00220 [Candidatus Pacebacteria bacterium CG10_big_fil_rev_8_21_14_0_10_36_11]PJC42416.1 MAG: hypothetical protein CO040_04610 [Candidatus Pacebacteria bacterium CG_4_9_14_0_2_um_fi
MFNHLNILFAILWAISQTLLGVAIAFAIAKLRKNWYGAGRWGAGLSTAMALLLFAHVYESNPVTFAVGIFIGLVISAIVDALFSPKTEQDVDDMY